MTAAILILLAAAWQQDDWAALLARYTTGESRVDYAALRREASAELERVVRRIAEPWPASFTAADRKAQLINAYNALTIRWMVDHYPVESIWKTKKPFTAARHTVDGKQRSLDDLETELRNSGDPRIHAALVCAARSCPPLRREPYTGSRLEEQLDDNARSWLARPELNTFDAAARRAKVSRIFDWYGKDFTGGVREFLSRYAPAAMQAFLADGKPLRIDYAPYHWGLNDTSALGSTYSSRSFYWDYVRNK